MTLTRRGLEEIADELEAAFDLSDAGQYRPRYNVAPTDLHFVLRLVDGGRRLVSAHWGLPASQAGRPPHFNARAETAPFKDAFRSAYATSRCVVPADGFFEWKTMSGGPKPTRQPIWYHRADGKLLLMAGLLEAGRFTVLTTTPNALVREVHDRMPALLSAAEAAAWLVAPSQRLLHPAPDGLLEGRPVSSRVNSVRNDDPACLAGPERDPAQLSLV